MRFHQDKLIIEGSEELEVPLEMARIASKEDLAHQQTTLSVTRLDEFDSKQAAFFEGVTFMSSTQD